MAATFLSLCALLGSRSAGLAIDSGFIESRCSPNPLGFLSIELRHLEGMSRTLTFEENFIRFEGTTFRDLKWIANYSDLKALTLLSYHPGATTGMLHLAWQRGGPRRMGWISRAAWEQLKTATAQVMCSQEEFMDENATP